MKINVIDLSEPLHGSFFDGKLYLYSEHDLDDVRRDSELDMADEDFEYPESI